MGLGETALCGGAEADRGVRLGESHDEGVPLGPDFVARVFLNGGPEELVVKGERRLEVGAVGLP